MRTEAETRAVLRDWVLKKASGLDPEQLADSTALFEQRYLRSVHLPELLLLLERLRGAPIEVEHLNLDNFGSLDAMVRFVCVPESAP
ncbi:hypothetical protein [Micromonospora sp. HM5-17]|jgi:hypothetical protein|uniref:hypothetical protein n=1 Tax=Micromonospora sp. HM5-17 TaxID=2487710 RepID=UPI0013154BA7|nr:hypothetical protein [Micromonospora sp. HM5-17]